MKKIISAIALIAVFSLFAVNLPTVQADDLPPITLYLPLIQRAPISDCHFGVAGLTARGDATYLTDLHTIKAGALVNWNTVYHSDPANKLPSDVTFLRVISVKGDTFDDVAKANEATGLANQFRGSYWQIGNEPDTEYEGQDNITAQEYGYRYFVLATAIRAADPTAKIGFGSIVQPTPIRLYYLNLAWEELKRLVREDGGTDEDASALIDFWSIHAFILNEQPHAPDAPPEQWPWGTGIPKGWDSSWGNPVVITNFADTYNINLFKNRIIAMRQWMLARGQRDKPLWITEYGSLLPPIDPPGENLVNVSDQVTASFMVQTFDFLYNTTNSSYGMPADGNKLVQRWFWYSLNDYRYKFGGTLFNPETGAITPVGTAYQNYTRNILPTMRCYP